MKKILFASLLSLALPALAQTGDILVIGHTNVPGMNQETVGRVYSGKITSVEGVTITPFNTRAGIPPRNEFLQRVVGMDDLNYQAHWTLRRYIGKGVPPKESASPSELVNKVQTTPGGIGYVDSAQAHEGVKVVLKVK